MASKCLLLIIAILILCGCSQSTALPTQVVVPTGKVTPYLTITPSLTPSPVPSLATIPVTPAPSPTPFLHTIAEKETMLGIAFEYGISLEELQAANPGVDPHFLSVGKQLIIPLSGEIQQVVPTITPAPLKIAQPTCFRSGEGGATCFIEITNSLDSGVENISAWVGLNSADGTNISSEVAYTPLNLLRAGQSMPLIVYFPPPLPEEFSPLAELLSGVIVTESDPRYLELEMEVEGIDISSDGKHAVVKGEVLVPENIPGVSQVWILAVAYDEAGNVVGARKWESGNALNFDLTVFSAGGKIDSVEVLVEGRPEE